MLNDIARMQILASSTSDRPTSDRDRSICYALKGMNRNNGVIAKISVVSTVPFRIFMYNPYCTGLVHNMAYE